MAGGGYVLERELREGCGGRPQGGAQRSGARERSAPRSSPTPRGKAARPARGGTPSGKSKNLKKRMLYCDFKAIKQA
ncbi:hypothetical protein JCM30197_09870 [Schleiferia thermophila]|nr:hypothetical protein JCM30197_09870 [Schleiferia thermophila]